MRAAFYITTLFLMACTATVPALAADAGACYAIQDADTRTYCLAKAHQQPGQCYAIQDQALRSECLAGVRK